MTSQVIQHSINKKISCGLLLVLVLVNIILFTIYQYSGPPIAIIFYAFAIYLCWRQNDFRAGIIIGIMGFVIHLYEFISISIMELDPLEMILFLINLLFPVLLVLFSVKAFKEYR